MQRHGRSKSPFYHVVVADSRAPRDGKFIEKIGSYLPQTQPATIELDVDRAVYWLHNGAQPTDTCRAILSYKGVLMKHHLELGVNKGAITKEVADERFNKWMSDKVARVEAHKDRVKKSTMTAAEARLAEEAKVNQARLERLAAKAAAAEAAARDAEKTADAEAAASEEMPGVPEGEATETPAE